FADGCRKECARSARKIAQALATFRYVALASIRITESIEDATQRPDRDTLRLTGRVDPVDRYPGRFRQPTHGVIHVTTPGSKASCARRGTQRAARQRSLGPQAWSGRTAALRGCSPASRWRHRQAA